VGMLCRVVSSNHYEYIMVDTPLGHHTIHPKRGIVLATVEEKINVENIRVHKLMKKIMSNERL
jgi:hypothetical protein